MKNIENPVWRELPRTPSFLQFISEGGEKWRNVSINPQTKTKYRKSMNKFEYRKRNGRNTSSWDGVVTWTLLCYSAYRCCWDIFLNFSGGSCEWKFHFGSSEFIKLRVGRKIVGRTPYNRIYRPFWGLLLYWPSANLSHTIFLKLRESHLPTISQKGHPEIINQFY